MVFAPPLGSDSATSFSDDDAARVQSLSTSFRHAFVIHTGSKASPPLPLSLLPGCPWLSTGRATDVADVVRLMVSIDARLRGAPLAPALPASASQPLPAPPKTADTVATLAALLVACGALDATDVGDDGAAGSILKTTTACRGEAARLLELCGGSLEDVACVDGGDAAAAAGLGPRAAAAFVRAMQGGVDEAA